MTEWEEQNESEAHKNPFSISELFHENSKQRRYDLQFYRRIYQINQSPSIQKITSHAFKTYKGVKTIPLPHKFPRNPLSFDDVILKRRSIRQFSGALLKLEEVARLLHFGNGITGKLTKLGQINQPLRAAPSGGALYPVEVYFIALHAESLEEGIYHYNVKENLLEFIYPGDVRSQLIRSTYYETIFDRASGVIVLTAIFERTTFKYGERGYRFILFEAGHIAQNILLTATSLNLGAVTIGGFIDEEINQMLDIDGVDEAALYLLVIGPL
jgi:SagB-type dehydrogenase family enzyme